MSCSNSCHGDKNRILCRNHVNRSDNIVKPKYCSSSVHHSKTSAHSHWAKANATSILLAKCNFYFILWKVDRYERFFLHSLFNRTVHTYPNFSCFLSVFVTLRHKGVRYPLTSSTSRSEKDQRAADAIENAQYELTLRPALSCTFVSSSDSALVCRPCHLARKK